GYTKSHDGINHSLIPDHPINVAVGASDCPKRGKFGQMVFRAGIERLGYDHRAHDHAEQRASEKRSAGTGSENPERAAAAEEFFRREDIHGGDSRLNFFPDQSRIASWLELDEQIAGFTRRQANVRTGGAEFREYIRRRCEGANAVSYGCYPYFVAAYF